MEIVYLLCSIISSFLTSLLLSFLLLFRRRRSTFTATGGGGDGVVLYQGTVWHERRRPVHHSFHYPVRYALFDLDLADSPPPPPDHLSAANARRIAGTSGPVLLLTIPPSVGYEQNPLSIYYCYNIDETLKHLNKCIAEVTNTPWGERVTFVFDPHSDFVAKPLHVSPFMDMLGNWNLKVNSPGDNISVTISAKHPVLGDYFVAALKLKRVPSELASEHAYFFWLMPHKVAVWIYWNALKLWWKNVPFIQHPRYSNPSYREEALTRDRSLKCCPHAVWDNENGSENLYENGCGERWFVWRDAKWPWS